MDLLALGGSESPSSDDLGLSAIDGSSATETGRRPLPLLRATVALRVSVAPFPGRGAAQVAEDWRSVSRSAARVGLEPLTK